MTYNLSPQIFEFLFRKPQPNEAFVFEKIVRNESAYLTAAYCELEELICNKKGEGQKIIYVSFGTLSGTNRQETVAFFRKLEVIVSTRTGYELVIASQDFKPSYENANIHVISFMPQVSFLTYADLMINHGGIGSIKECLHANVKMLSYALNPRTDQRGCAVRVEVLGLGLKGDIKRDTIQDIEQKIDFLLAS